jgi:hypothetical protein
MPLISVNITSVSKSTKTLGELKPVQKDTHKLPVIVHSQPCPVQVNGTVTILNGLLPPIWIIMILMVMETSLLMMIFLSTT